ncbi:hypothetical protein CONLIGDRAFT_631382 [Coniochaeta ligniaria NRRL 30616]|uniref:Gfd2/YDR514C-like C-terminal domain-containing protein n=1 Tax=Coniochaeta ligniaria NRRL 30616 TaxID=1408157 RepID=A0A1J7IUV3_9PEZI|nr:hypothetical protein CONLIGDRAFT_631382 [Coniochaeta ligniaria NRRL 30616]
MAPSGSDWTATASYAAQALVNNNERELLRRIWLEADAKPTVFVSVDTEYTNQGVCELGLATRQKHTPTFARHFIVNSTRGLKQKNPKPFNFGLSEEVRHEENLRPILVDTLARLQAENEVVVLVGHDVQVELGNLRKHCGWELPGGVLVLDTLHIWRSWINVPTRGNLEQALEFFDLLKEQPANLHNAGNDARYTMELLVHKAIQAVECPVPMGKTDLEVHDAKPEPAVRPSKRDHHGPITPGSGTRAERKRKRMAQQNLESNRLAPSPQSFFEHRRVTRSKRRKMDDNRNGVTRDRVGEAQGPGIPAAEANIIDLIDLTGNTPPRQEPAGSSPMVIDLTDNTPPPLPQPREWSHHGFMDSANGLEPRERMGPLDAGTATVSDLRVSNEDESGAMDKRWYQEMKGMVKDMLSGD